MTKTFKHYGKECIIKENGKIEPVSLPTDRPEGVEFTLADKLVLGDVFAGEKYQHILNCVNSHEKLVEALKLAKEHLNRCNDCDHNSAESGAIALDKINKALGKAGDA